MLWHLAAKKETIGVSTTKELEPVVGIDKEVHEVQEGKQEVRLPNHRMHPVSGLL
jgi:hypothetical protein